MEMQKKRPRKDLIIAFERLIAEWRELKSKN